MIFLMSQVEADRHQVKPGIVQCISPYLNPAHVLAPPRGWLEALVRGEFSWHFFRLRYKSLLRKRFRADPERFFALLDASGNVHPLVLTCHCLSNPCHREIARDFLENLRLQPPYCRRSEMREAVFAAMATRTARGGITAHG